MTYSNDPARALKSATFIQDSLAYAIAAVHCYEDLAPELIAEQVFEQLAHLAGKRSDTSAVTVWLSRIGGFTSRLEAFKNGEQLIAPAGIAWGLST